MDFANKMASAVSKGAELESDFKNFLSCHAFEQKGD